MTLEQLPQKINDCLGVPGRDRHCHLAHDRDPRKPSSTWTTTKSTCPFSATALHNVLQVYPYDVAPNVNTPVTPASPTKAACTVIQRSWPATQDEIQKNVTEAGIETSKLASPTWPMRPEIAAVMLQHQQASTIMDPRKMIVDGASHGGNAHGHKNENKVVELDDEPKAAMISTSWSCYPAIVVLSPL